MAYIGLPTWVSRCNVSLLLHAGNRMDIYGIQITPGWLYLIKTGEFVLFQPHTLGWLHFKITFKLMFYQNVSQVCSLLFSVMMMKFQSAFQYMYRQFCQLLKFEVNSLATTLGSLITDASENLQILPINWFNFITDSCFISLTFILFQGQTLRDAVTKSFKEN